MKRLDYYWYTRSPWLVLLTPFSLVYRIVVELRRLAYRYGLARSHRPGIPVIVVGNITAGGTGKTPLVAWLASHLQSRGYRPGIISRGYGGSASHWPQLVHPDSDPDVVGDEPVLLAELTGCPMAVAPRRVAAVQTLIEHSDCNVIISDDGLQHYALQRDLEIAVVDGVRRFGSGYSLPAGPLREPVRRLQEVDLVVVNGKASGTEYSMRMRLERAHRLKDRGVTRPLSDFRGRTVHAVAGIGNPERFFHALQQTGMQLIRHAFPDHHRFTPADIGFDDGRPVIMTGKDAVKCRPFASDNDWYVPVRVELSAGFSAQLDALLEARLQITM